MGPASVSGSSGLSPYKRRRPLPALVLFLVLAVVAVFVWVNVLGTASDVDAAIKCNPPGNVVASGEQPTTTAEGEVPPPQPVKLGTAIAHDALDRTDPVPVQDIHFRVFNASTQRNQARFVAISLSEMGLKQAAEPVNDPAYPAGDMSCRGQIRFGATGAGAARTLSLLEPCLELVRDDRQDAIVDVAIGQKFDEVKPNNDARKVLDQLNAWVEQHPEQQGGQAAQAGVPSLAVENVQAARDVHC